MLGWLALAGCALGSSRHEAATPATRLLDLRAVDVTHSSIVNAAVARSLPQLDDFYDRYGYPIPDGDWLAVTVESTNASADRVRLSASAFTLRLGSGRRFPAVAWPGEPEEYSLAPGATLAVRLKFDGAPAVAQGRVIFYRGVEQRTIYLD